MFKNNSSGFIEDMIKLHVESGKVINAQTTFLEKFTAHAI